ncbi:methylaspartate ammonia-lyase, partial [Ramicandelaber brevisporus]
MTVSAPMTIASVAFVVGKSGYYNKDLLAVKLGARPNGTVYEGDPVTPGYTKIVQPGKIISVMLILNDGQVAVGECADVIYSGLAGRDPLFVPSDYMAMLESHVQPWLVGRSVDSFRGNAETFDEMIVEGHQLHTAIRYGVTQALLCATAMAKRLTMTEVICNEYSLKLQPEVVKILASCHRGDKLQLDRVILKHADLLPHASFNTIEDVGPNGELLLDYIAGISERVQEIGDKGYKPTIHVDVYGSLGDLFGKDIDSLVEYFAAAAKRAEPFSLLIETPTIAETRADQISTLKTLRLRLKAAGIKVGIIADEWCNTLDDIRAFVDAQAADYVQIKTPDLGGINNTIEAVVYCNNNGVGCCLGGTANETDLSARISAHIGLATKPSFMLSKPGLGADEGLMILSNEMLRTIAL